MYSQIEKETLAITFACEKFRHFVYGREIIIETDHRPLVAIASKGIGDMPPRLQHFFLRLLTYDYKLRFMPGKQLVLADMLSRSLRPSNEKYAGSTEDEVHAVAVMLDLVSTKTLNRLVVETTKNQELQAVSRYVEEQGGDSLEGPVKQLASELSEVQGVLLKGCKVANQRYMRPQMLKRIHEGHLNLKSKARVTERTDHFETNAASRVVPGGHGPLPVRGKFLFVRL